MTKPKDKEQTERQDAASILSFVLSNQEPVSPLQLRNHCGMSQVDWFSARWRNALAEAKKPKISMEQQLINHQIALEAALQFIERHGKIDIPTDVVVSIIRSTAAGITDGSRLVAITAGEVEVTKTIQVTPHPPCICGDMKGGCTQPGCAQAMVWNIGWALVRAATTGAAGGLL